MSDTLGHSDTRIRRGIYHSVLPHIGKSAAEATAKVVPLQPKTEAEEAVCKAEKLQKKAHRAKKAESEKRVPASKSKSKEHKARRKKRAE
ncbi:hypothetical protein [Streptomyces sp. ALB3]|uniref:hypothetical protein n=1 Tax=Streptomyces sp. ALB3 TaxID=3374278 RepID=UPI00378B927F